MTKRKSWEELAPKTREVRFAPIAQAHLPKPKTVITFAQKHARCANRGKCTGPGCRA